MSRLALTRQLVFDENLGTALDISGNALEGDSHSVDLKLHDETIQALYGVSLRLQVAAGLVGETPESIAGELDHAVRTIDNVIADLRDRIEDLTGQEHDESATGYLRR